MVLSYKQGIERREQYKKAVPEGRVIRTATSKLMSSLVHLVFIVSPVSV
jgi:hypothetical protein